MRVFSRSMIRFSLLALLAGLIVCPARGQLVIQNEALTQNNSQQLQSEKQTDIPNKPMSFAEKQYLLSVDVSSYRDKYSITCMIYTYTRNLLSVELIMFSTYKINRCKPDSFIKTTAAGVKAQLLTKYAVDLVVISGPHLQMMDFNNTPVDNRFIPIGDLNFSPIAKANLGITDILLHYSEWSRWIRTLQFYNPIRTNQDADFTWFPGSKIYTLTNDKNETFIMTNLIADNNIHSEHEVERVATNLGKFLNLPKGWRYQVSVLDKVLQIRQLQFKEGSTTHLQDDYGNIYMKLPTD